MIWVRSHDEHRGVQGHLVRDGGGLSETWLHYKEVHGANAASGAQIPQITVRGVKRALPEIVHCVSQSSSGRGELALKPGTAMRETPRCATSYMSIESPPAPPQIHQSGECCRAWTAIRLLKLQSNRALYVPRSQYSLRALSL